MRNLASKATADLERLATGLREPVAVDAAVHTTRKGIKRLRAFLRLARRSVGKDFYRSENSALRDTARLLAPARDSLVLIETATAIGASDAVVASLAGDHREAIAGLESGVRIDAADRLSATAERWQHVDWGGPDAASIRAGLRRTYRRGLADFESVRSNPSDATFHGWRRRVKYIRYQLEIVGVASDFTRPFTILGDDLGLEHDHTVLIDVCRSRTADGAFRTVAHGAAQQREMLRSTALALGGRLFALAPEAYVESVDGMAHLP